MIRATWFSQRTQHSRDCREMLPGMYKQSPQAAAPGWKSPGCPVLPFAFAKTCGAGLFWDGWFPPAIGGMLKGEEMGSCLHTARVSLGDAGVTPPAVSVPQPSVSADLGCRIANMSIFGLHAGFLWFCRCARFSVTAQLLSLSYFMDQILNQGKIREEWARLWLWQFNSLEAVVRMWTASAVPLREETGSRYPGLENARSELHSVAGRREEAGEAAERLVTVIYVCFQVHVKFPSPI